MAKHYKENSNGLGAVYPFYARGRVVHVKNSFIIVKV